MPLSRKCYTRLTAIVCATLATNWTGCAPPASWCGAISTRYSAEDSCARFPAFNRALDFLPQSSKERDANVLHQATARSAPATDNCNIKGRRAGRP